MFFLFVSHKIDTPNLKIDIVFLFEFSFVDVVWDYFFPLYKSTKNNIFFT
jgi:hypothetical protein